MILDHISIAAIRLPKFTNKGICWVHAASRKFCKCWKEQLTQLTSELYFHFVEIKRQNKRKETVKYSGTQDNIRRCSVVHWGLDSSAGRPCRILTLALFNSSPSFVATILCLPEGTWLPHKPEFRRKNVHKVMLASSHLVFKGIIGNKGLEW